MTCAWCGAALPAPRLDVVYVTCAYCGKADRAPPPPPEAWLAQHHELVKRPIETERQMARLGTWMVRGYLLIFVVPIVAGIVAALIRLARCA